MIKIVTVNNAGSRLIAEVAKDLGIVFRMPVVIDASVIPDKFGYDENKGQYPAQSLIESLKKINAGTESRTIGITDLDLSYPGLNFIFGLADEESLTAVVSTARFGAGEAKNRLIERTIKTAIHELGHTFGISHCRNNKCVMFFSYNLRDTDYKEKNFCRRCRKIIEGKLLSEGS